MLQYYDFTAPSTGAFFPVASSGRFLYYLDGSAGGADNTISVRAGNTGQSVLLKPGQSIRLADEDKSVDTWYVSNYKKAAAILGTLLVGDGAFEDNRISGSVEVIDGSRTRALNNGSFMGSASLGPGAGNIAILQLWNPPASGKNIFVDSVKINSSAANGVYMRDSNAALANLYGAGAPKKIGGVAGVGVTRTAAQAAQPGGSVMLSGDISAGAMVPIDLRGPIFIPPGYGLVVNGNAAAVNLTANFEWYEENQ